MEICWLCFKHDKNGKYFTESRLCGECDKVVHDHLVKNGDKVKLQDVVWCQKRDLAVSNQGS